MHSLAMDHRFWRLVAPALAADGPVLCVDLRGHGQSSKPQGPYTVAQMAADVAALVRALGFERAVAAGASLGGCVAQQLALDNPGLIAALGLFDTTSWYGETALKDWAERAAKAREQGLSSMVNFQLTRWFGDAFRAAQPDIMRECAQIFVANDLEGYAATCAALGAFDASARVSSLTIPTAILVGEEDYATPVAMAQYLHQHIRGSTLQILPGARHLTPLEAPQAVVQSVQTLRSRLEA
jgi:3-oxoadipate enol-lactonase